MPAGADRGALARMLAQEGFSGRDLMVVLAHPDDETIGLGGQLADLPGVTLVHVTDGAPRDGQDAAAHGFADVPAYAAARLQELEAAMTLAGVAPGQLIALGFSDQTASHHLLPIVHRLADLFRQREPAVVLTHAYEGGHPDHDAVVFAVQAVAMRLAALGFSAPRLIEVPLYHEGAHGFAGQSFADPRPGDVTVTLGPAVWTLKGEMLACHASQAETLAQFTGATESFRWAEHHDFSELPNAGRLYYERFGWGLDGRAWLRIVEAAEAELGLQA